jgi:acetyltransferase-like isoleucine patch superfamily enzyme
VAVALDPFDMMSPDRRTPADPRVANGLVADDDVILGYPPARSAEQPLVLGADARLRSGTILYAGAEIGRDFETGHHVVVRESTRIGDQVSVWSNTVIDYGCVIGSRVKIHCNCYVAQFTELEDDVFLAPGVTIANDLFPGQAGSASVMAGPLIRARAQIGINVTILPYVTIGEAAIIGSGSVVTRDVPPGMVAYGNPARPTRRVEDVADSEMRLRAAYTDRIAASHSSVAAGRNQ